MVGERGYLNYVPAHEPLERVRAAFGEGGFDRVRDLKGVFDPGNVLRRNQSIPPPAILEHTAPATRPGRKT